MVYPALLAIGATLLGCAPEPDAVCCVFEFRQSECNGTDDFSEWTGQELLLTLDRLRETAGEDEDVTAENACDRFRETEEICVQENPPFECCRTTEYRNTQTVEETCPNDA